MSTQVIAVGPASALFPKTRRAVLGLLYSHPGETFYLRQIVDLTGLAVGQVQRELKLLSGTGILTRTEQGRHVYFRANDKCAIFEELRAIVTKTMGAAAVIGESLKNLDDQIRVAFVFGSVARGEETNTSDLDLMVIGDITFAEAAVVVRSAEQQIRREINLSVYPVDEYRSKTLDNHYFLRQVLSQEKLFIVGDQHELESLLEQPVDS